MSFVHELKRRNVFKVAVAYVIVAWLLLQVSDTLVPALHLPEWFNSGVAFLLIIGFPIAMIFAWAFEMTPDGLKKEKDVDRSQSITNVTGQKLNNAIIGILVLALAYFAIDKFMLDPGRDAEEIAVAVQNAQDQEPSRVESEEIDRSIAVLPFVNMSSDKEQEYFSDGLSEELLNLLAKIPELRVAARTSSFSFKGKNLEIPEIASRLKVAHVLEGSVRKSGNQIRITAQLIQADNGYHLWTETFDRELNNIFEIQDEIAVAVVDALKITLLGEAPRVRETDPRAYQLFLEGQFHRRQVTDDSLTRSIELFEQALKIDPGYPPAWAELAYAHIWMAGTSDQLTIAQANQLADQEIETAIKLDPEYGFAYFVRGVSKMFNKFDFKGGAEDYQRALKLDPGNAFLIAATGTSARLIGRFDESVMQYQSALIVDPIMPEVLAFLAITQYYSGHLQEAEANFIKTLALSPNFAGVHYRLGRVLLSMGNPEEALTRMESESSSVYHLTGLAMAHHSLDNHEQSQEALEALIDGYTQGAAFQVAEVYAYRGETDLAFDWLDIALKNRDSGLASTLGDPAFMTLHNDPRWQAFLDKLGLLEFWLEMPAEYGGPLK